MDRTSFREAVLADYILKAENWDREKLLQETISLKCLLLESQTDSEIITEINEEKLNRWENQ
ncbi:MAG: hypothetical protein WCX69_05065 [Candidatus Paceibacterota bacterium]